jgi:hypothetical protein
VASSEFYFIFVAKIHHFAIRKQKIPSNVFRGNFGKNISPDLEEESYEIAKIFLENSSFNSSIERAIYS